MMRGMVGKGFLEFGKKNQGGSGLCVDVSKM